MERITTSHGKSEYPVLVLMVRANLEKVMKGMEVDGFIAKPFAVDALLSQIEKILSKDSSSYVFLLGDSQLTHIWEIAQILQKERYQTVIVEDYERLIKKCEECSPNVILMDYAQDGLGGAELIHKMKSQPVLKDVPIIVYDYPVLSHYRKKSLKAGASKFLDSLEKFDSLVSTVKELELKEIK